MSAPAVFRQSRGLVYADVNGVGGVNVKKLRTVPGTGGAESVPGSGINMPILDPRDKAVTKTLRDQLTAAGCRVALFTDPHWYAGTFPAWAGCPKDENGKPLPDPLLYRRQLSSDVSRLLELGDPVFHDYEKVPRAWLERFLIGGADTTVWGWRGRFGRWDLAGTNPGREGAYTVEPHQELPVDLIVKAGWAYVAQLYDGAMNDKPAWQELVWELSQQVNGFRLDPADCFPTYDARDYQPDELAPTGVYLFDSNRLTWLFT